MPPLQIPLSAGSGTRLMQRLIRDLLLPRLSNPILEELTDSALIPGKGKLAFTTDSFVVSPLFFPGADIGRLAVCGTVNDLVMMGAKPAYLSLAFIIEEGLDYRIFEKIVASISLQATRAGVLVVCGDLKVVEKDACDKLFINTSGIGRVLTKKNLSLRNINPGDKIILTGNIAQHGLAVLAKRKGLDLGLAISSDCAPLNGLILPVLEKTAGIKFMRDPTRGGLAATLNEIAQGSRLGITINEKDIPISAKVKAACELLGIDPLGVACEGRAILITQAKSASRVLNLLKRHSQGTQARIIGRVTKWPKATVVLNTILGTERILDMPVSDALPRIC